MKYAVLIFAVALLSGCYSKSPENTKHHGEPLPEFSLFLADSSTYFKTTSLPANKPVILLYFGARCPYSRAQMENIVHDINNMKDIEIVALTSSPFVEMKWFNDHYKLDNYSNIRTGVDYTNFFLDYLSPKGVPYMAIYGSDHTLKGVYPGQTSVTDLKKLARS